MKEIKSFFKVIVVLILISVSINILAEDVQTEVSPQEPVINESFFVTFKIKATGDNEPYITFTPVGVQVLGKREQGVSIQTIVVNGKFTSTREQNVVYELIADHSGTAMIKNIKIDLNGKTTNLKDLHINVLATPKRIPEAFMEATVSKTRVYVGEGIDVNYYLYFKSSINANDVKDFPKLNKFIKRFHHINSPVETVQYKGEVLKRILAYSARIYPEKVGQAVIDSMKISVQVIESDYNGFGFGAQRFKNKDLASNRIEIEVLPLPAENVPAGFTGLVGEHEFSFIPAKEKYLVNEPIELKLEVKGKGALEKMDAPGIYSDPNLETFDTKSEVTEIGTNSAKKLFEYTYLARSALKINNRELNLSFFDPNTGKYVEKKISIPGFEVSGIAAPVASGSDKKGNLEKNEATANKGNDLANDFLSKWFGGNNSNAATDSNQPKTVIKNILGIVGPIFKEPSSFTSNLYRMINIVVVALILLTGWSWYRLVYSNKLEVITNNVEARKLLKKLKSNGLDHSNLYKILMMLDGKNKMSAGGISLQDLINESEMSREAKLYFKNSLEACEQKGYGINKATSEVKFENKYFNELMKFV